MSLFSGLFGNYAKEGPGVSKDEPKKPPFIRFFQLYFRKFWKLVQLNLIFLVPAVVFIGLFLFLYLGASNVPVPISFDWSSSFEFSAFRTFVAPLPMVFLSPFVAGLCYVTRNFVREEHAFVFSDFKDAVKGNWKYFLLNGFVCYLVYSLLFTAIRFYGAFYASNKIMIIPLGLSFLFLLLFTFAQFYFPVMAITFDLKFKQLYKNAFIFAILGFPRNLLILLLLGVLVVLLSFWDLMGLTVILALLFVVMLLFSTVMYMINFIVYPMIEKYLLKPYMPEEEKKDESENISPLLSDQEMASLESEFIYVNGKLIRREEYEEELKRRKTLDE